MGCCGGEEVYEEVPHSRREGHGKEKEAAPLQPPTGVPPDLPSEKMVEGEERDDDEDEDDLDIREEAVIEHSVDEPIRPVLPPGAIEESNQADVERTEDGFGPLVVSPSLEQTQWLLEPMRPELKGRKCLVLDLDETLVHASFKLIQQADFVIPVEIDGQYHNVYVIKRPGVDAFMKKMGELYEVVVFTASVSKVGLHAASSDISMANPCWTCWTYTTSSPIDCSASHATTISVTTSKISRNSAVRSPKPSSSTTPPPAISSTQHMPCP